MLRSFVMPMFNLKIISQDSEYFPKKLLDLPDCPEVLFVIGNEKLLNTFCISIVGTRNSSHTGNEIAFDLSQKLSSCGITIVSGLADGIDTNAHSGTFECGKTIAIIASGFNHISSQKKSLITKIVNNGGAVISEYFPDVPPKKYSFLHRNRLIAAISEALIVVEAPIKSGAINTAKIAKKLNRKLFTIPWNINAFRGEGCNNLIESGAKILTNYKQILESLNYTYRNSILVNTNNTCKSTIKHKTIPEEFKNLYKFIEDNEPCSKEKIFSNFSNKNIANINSSLTLMEFDNLISFKENEYFIS